MTRQKAGGQCTCKKCNIRFGAAEHRRLFQGRNWHEHCLIDHANQTLRGFDDSVRISKMDPIGDWIVKALNGFTLMSKSKRQEFQEFITFCVDFMREVLKNPNAIPVIFQPALIKA